MAFSWQTQTFPDGRIGASATAGSFHLVVTQAVHPESKQPVGFAFKVIGMQGGGTNFMSCSPTLEEAQSRAEFTFLTFLLGGLCVVDKEVLDAYIGYVKPALDLPLESAIAMATELEKRNMEIMNQAAAKGKDAESVVEPAATAAAPKE